MGRGIDRVAVAASASLFVFLCAIDISAGQESCTNVTVTGGGDLAGDYSLTSESSYVGQTETHILQAIVYGDDSSRRALRQSDEREEGAGTGARRSLANDCTTQSWYLADTAALEDGFPFYQAFDCAEHPADIDEETDWVLVTCEDCSEIVFVSISCTVSVDTGESQADGDGGGDDGDDGMFTVGVIAGIAAAAGVVVLLLCVGLLCAARRKKNKSEKGNSTFTDDSDHDSRLKAAGAGAGAGAGALAGAGGGTAAVGTASSTANADSDTNANASTSASTITRGMGFGRARSRSKVMGKGKGSFQSDSKAAAVAGASGVAGAPGATDASLSSTRASEKRPTRLFPSGANAKSFKPGHQAVEGVSYEGMFASQGSGGGTGGAGGGGSSSGGVPTVALRHESRAVSMDVDTKKDSMSVAAAAAAARAAKARGEVEKGPPPALGNVLHSGVVADGRRAGAGVGAGARTGARTGARAGAGADAGGGITWSAGQDVYPRRARHGGGGGGGHAAAAAFVAGDDSAAGSVYSAAGGQRYNRDDDDDDDYYYDGDEGQPLQHTYNDECGESVPASSPGTYSLYSHYTAGGNTYRGGHSEAAWSSDGDEDGGVGGGGVGSVGGRTRQHQRLRSAQAAMVIPVPNVPPTVVLEVTGGHGQSAKMLSPAGHLARVDRNSVSQDGESGEFSRR